MMRDRLIPWLLAVVIAAAVLLGGLLLARDAQGVQPDAYTDLLAEWEALNRRAEWHLERAVWHLDEFDALIAEMARVGYRIRRHDDTTVPHLDLGGGP